MLRDIRAHFWNLFWILKNHSIGVKTSMLDCNVSINLPESESEDRFDIDSKFFVCFEYFRFLISAPWRIISSSRSRPWVTFAWVTNWCWIKSECCYYPSFLNFNDSNWKYLYLPAADARWLGFLSRQRLTKSINSGLCSAGLLQNSRLKEVISHFT